MRRRGLHATDKMSLCQPTNVVPGLTSQCLEMTLAGQSGDTEFFHWGDHLCNPDNCRNKCHAAIVGKL